MFWHLFNVSASTVNVCDMWHCMNMVISNNSMLRCHGDVRNLKTKIQQHFLPRCMECRRGLAMRKLSVCLSVRLFVKRVHCDKTEE